MSLLSISHLSEIAEFRSGGTPDRNNDDFYSGSIPWITGADIGGDGAITPRSFITEQAIAKSATGRARIGDILLVSRTSVGKVTVTNLPVCFSQDITAITPDTRIVNDRYLLHYLRSRTQYFTDRSRGATIKGVTRKVIEELEVPLLPLEEQRRIAQLLDNVDALRAKRRAAITLLDNLAQSIFLDMFGDPVSNSKGWPMVRLAELGTLDRGVSKHRPRNSPELLGGKYPLIQTGDVATSRGYITEWKATYSDIGFAQSRLWPSGTLCITIAANIAKTGILKFDACFPDSVVGFSSTPDVAEYVQVWLSFHQKSLEHLAPESAQKNINLAVLRGLEISNPGSDLISSFAQRIRATNVLKATFRSHLAEFDALFASLQHRAFRGELWLDSSAA